MCNFIFDCCCIGHEINEGDKGISTLGIARHFLGLNHPLIATLVTLGAPDDPTEEPIVE